MRRALLSWLCVLAVVAPHEALAQSYQHYSDGLVSVQARKVADQGQRIGFEVCVQVLREEKVCPLEVHLSFREASGRLLAQASSVLRPEPSAPACYRIALPDEAKDMSRWEVSRFRCQRQGMPERPMDQKSDVAPAHRDGIVRHPEDRVGSELESSPIRVNQREAAATETCPASTRALTFG